MSDDKFCTIIIIFTLVAMAVGAAPPRHQKPEREEQSAGTYQASCWGFVSNQTDHADCLILNTKTGRTMIIDMHNLPPEVNP